VALAGQNGILIADNDNGAIREITQAPMVGVRFMPRAPNGKHGWYTRAPMIAVAVNTINTTIVCVVDPGQAPPVFAAFAPGCRFARGFEQFRRNGTHTIYASAENTFDDPQNPVKATFKVDITRPKLSCLHEPSFRLDQSKAKVHALLRDAVSGPAVTEVSVSADVSHAGRHTVKVRGVNRAGLSGRVVCPYIVRRP
jgi:hypothetical protein